MTPANSWRVMTWNVHGAAQPDLQRLAEAVRDQRPDVLAVQEIRARQAAGLAQQLGWQHHWARKHYPYSPLVWWLAEGAAVMSPHSITHPVRRSLSPGVSTWTYRHRVVLAATIGRADASIRVYDTHLASHTQPDERIEQAGRVASMIADDAPPTAVVAGDLNAPGEVEVIRQFHRVGLRDPGGGPTHPSMSPRRRLDYILVPETARITEQHSPDGGDAWRELSDHVPVLVEFASPSDPG
jgi:endonuclease/exonuclease/phosphatase family metal-dependent hydrolase